MVEIDERSKRRMLYDFIEIRISLRLTNTLYNVPILFFVSTSLSLTLDEIILKKKYFVTAV